jgi:hypothetical protein
MLSSAVGLMPSIAALLIERSFDLKLLRLL